MDVVIYRMIEMGFPRTPPCKIHTAYIYMRYPTGRGVVRILSTPPCKSRATLYSYGGSYREDCVVLAVVGPILFLLSEGARYITVSVPEPL